MTLTTSTTNLTVMVDAINAVDLLISIAPDPIHIEAVAKTLCDGIMGLGTSSWSAVRRISEHAFAPENLSQSLLDEEIIFEITPGSIYTHSLKLQKKAL